MGSFTLNFALSSINSTEVWQQCKYVKW